MPAPLEKTHDHVHYMIIKKTLEEVPIPPVVSRGIPINAPGIYYNTVDSRQCGQVRARIF